MAKSDCSMRTTEWPREAASTAAPRPVAPPPMIAMSKGPVWAESWEKRWPRFMRGRGRGKFAVVCGCLRLFAVVEEEFTVVYGGLRWFTVVDDG